MTRAAAHVIRLHHSRLVRHPANMRLKYRAADVMQMAMSQAERVKRGQEPCIQALVVTPGAGLRFDPKSSQKLIIVAGHLRHAGNVRLGTDAPLLNCIVQEYPNEEAMLADMRTENGKRIEPSPLGWAKSYQSSLKDGNKDERTLARESGKTVDFVRTMQDLLGLAPAAQKLIDQGELPTSAIRHLKRIADPELQAEIALKAARHKAGEKGVRLAVERSLTKHQTKRKPAPPTVSTRRQPSIKAAPDELPATLGDLRRGAAATCMACSAPGKLRGVEPAWHIALAAAGQTCEMCSVRDDKGACDACALPEMMTRVARSVAGVNGNGR